MRNSSRILIDDRCTPHTILLYSSLCILRLGRFLFSGGMYRTYIFLSQNPLLFPWRFLQFCSTPGRTYQTKIYLPRKAVPLPKTLLYVNACILSEWYVCKDVVEWENRRRSIDDRCFPPLLAGYRLPWLACYVLRYSSGGSATLDVLPTSDASRRRRNPKWWPYLGPFARKRQKRCQR